MATMVSAASVGSPHLRIGAAVGPDFGGDAGRSVSGNVGAQVIGTWHAFGTGVIAEAAFKEDLTLRLGGLLGPTWRTERGLRIEAYGVGGVHRVHGHTLPFVGGRIGFGHAAGRIGASPIEFGIHGFHYRDLQSVTVTETSTRLGADLAGDLFLVPTSRRRSIERTIGGSHTGVLLTISTAFGD